MKRKLISVILTLVLALSLCLVTAVPVAAQDGSYLGTPPTIDGDLSEWEAFGTQYIYADGCLGGEQIGTGKLYMAFDDENFYLAYKLEDAGAGDDYLYAFNGGFWFPDASGYNSSGPQPSEFVLTEEVLELSQSWEGVRGTGAVYGEWMIEIVSNNAARIIRFGSMQATTGVVTNLAFYAGSYDGEDPFPGSYITDGISKDLWIMTGFSVFDAHFGQYSVAPPEVWVDDGGSDANPGTEVEPLATIQKGIDIVATGGTVNVAAGTYNESITIDKANLTLESVVLHGATIDGGTKAAILIKAEGVTVDGFEILSSYVSAVYAYTGSDNAKVLNNAVAGGGIYIDFSSGVEILGNSITAAPHIAIFPFGDTGITIENNEVTDSANGILVHQTDGATVKYNTISGISGDAAMQIVGSRNVVIEFNVIINNDAVGIQHGTAWWEGAYTPENNVAHYNNIVGNELGVENWAEAAFYATNNWWGHSSGPSAEGKGSGDAISPKVDAQPWLLTEDTEVTYDQTLALNPDWSIVSPDSELASYTVVDSVDLILTYDKGGWTEIFELDPVTPVFIKTADGGGIGFNYAGSSQGIFTTNLEAGWNLIGVPQTGATPEAILSSIRLGANNEVALATLASQGNYNPSEVTFYESMLNTGSVPGEVELHPFDGYWASMNVAKEFGVVVIPDGPKQN